MTPSYVCARYCATCQVTSSFSPSHHVCKCEMQHAASPSAHPGARRPAPGHFHACVCKVLDGSFLCPSNPPLTHLRLHWQAHVTHSPSTTVSPARPGALSRPDTLSVPTHSPLAWQDPFPSGHPACPTLLRVPYVAPPSSPRVCQHSRSLHTGPPYEVIVQSHV